MAGTSVCGRSFYETHLSTELLTTWIVQFSLSWMSVTDESNSIDVRNWAMDNIGGWRQTYLTKFLDFGSTATNNATNLALMNQETGIWVADTAGSFASNLWNLELKNQWYSLKLWRTEKLTSSSDGRTFWRTLMTASRLPWMVRILKGKGNVRYKERTNISHPFQQRLSKS